MKMSSEELYIKKVEAFLFGLKNKTKKVGDINIQFFIKQIAKTNIAMANELERKFDIQTNNIKFIVC